MTFDRDVLINAAKDMEMQLTENNLSDFGIYADLLYEWNQKMNLTAIREPEKVSLLHFADSLSLLKVFELADGQKVIDVGTGAGFPGVPLKIMRGDIKLTLLDSLNKRIVFLDELSKCLKQSNETIHARAEDGGKNPDLREQFDVAVSRAVASLPLLAEYCLPYVCVGGYFIAYKGPGLEAELDDGERVTELLGGKLEKSEKLILSDGSERNIIIIKKISQTSPKYPRSSANIAKKPL